MTGRDDYTQYKVVMTNRKNLLVEGVHNVESFDDAEIILDTKMGTLILKGENLHVVQLNLEDGNFVVEGVIKSLDFSEEKRGIKGKGKGFIERILR